MKNKKNLSEHRFFAPEVIQTSAMDCGPATLKCILDGFGIPVSYGRLREACQTDVDGTSIDVMEDVSVRLGLDAEQVMIPADHLFVPSGAGAGLSSVETGRHPVSTLFSECENLPAIVITRLPNGLTHFVVAWRLHGRFIQVMDPGKGRCWMTQRAFSASLYLHTHLVSSEDWREWAGTEDFYHPLQYRMAALGLEYPQINRLTETALADSGWYSIAALDAATRMTDAIVRSKGLLPGKEAGKVLGRFFEKACQKESGGTHVIPSTFWSVSLCEPDVKAGAGSEPAPREESLFLRGTVLVRIKGRRAAVSEKERTEEQARLSPELIAALEEKTPRPELEILRFLREDGLWVPSLLILSLAMAVFCVTIEALLFRGLLDIGTSLNLFGQRFSAAGIFFLFVIGILLLKIPIFSAIQRMGRRFEIRFRIAVLKKIPRLSDRYFHSRLTSDMTQRVHELRSLRTLPGLAMNIFRLSFQIILTVTAVIILVPKSAGIALLATFFAVSMSFVSQPILIEQDMRLRTHLAAMSRFYLDALLGLIPIRTHHAERAVRREHENLLLEWVHTSMDFLKAITFVGAAESLIQIGFVIWLLFDYIGKGGDHEGILLLFYWTLNLPILGKMLAGFTQQYPMHRNRILRLLEPLTASEEGEVRSQQGVSSPQRPKTKARHPKPNADGISILLENIMVHAGGQTILKNINLSIKAGEHIAVVGASGAGKSSLVGIFLGWHRPAKGWVWVDDKRLGGENLRSLRRETVWVDPEVQLWNRSLFENLHYGTYSEMPSLSKVIGQADLFSVLETLPNGMKTRLGENGGLVSGGEGQRVRLGRGMLRDRIRLVILDEPFRGLDREKRRVLLRRARAHWKDATLIFISHDVGEALNFDRVLVIEAGQIAEDDSPSRLAEQPNSRYCHLLKSEEAVRKGLWESAEWRHLWLENGKIEERGSEE